MKFYKENLLGERSKTVMPSFNLYLRYVKASWVSKSIQTDQEPVMDLFSLYINFKSLSQNGLDQINELKLRHTDQAKIRFFSA